MDEKETVVVKQKRGRKPKKAQTVDSDININSSLINELVSNSIINDQLELNNMNEDKEEDVEDENKSELIENNVVKPGPKKRGRKPKGGKIVQQSLNLNTNKETKPNIILHLKCWMKDLQTNVLNTDIESFHFVSNKTDLQCYELSDNLSSSSFNNENDNYHNSNSNIGIVQQEKEVIFDQNNTSDNYNDDDYVVNNKEVETKEIWKKLKQLEHNLHINNINNKKSACFWCTYDFDNPPIYIPKHFIKDSYNVYGCFCSPECAVGFLMEENIDSSCKFERYYLLNHIYSKIYDYKKNIKPAPNPYYMLERYYGNLSIQEYRSLLKNERLFLIIEKPLTRILPELHEDNDDFIINNKVIPSNNYQVRKKIQKKNQSKNNIVCEKFGITS